MRLLGIRAPAEYLCLQRRGAETARAFCASSKVAYSQNVVLFSWFDFAAASLVDDEIIGVSPPYYLPHRHPASIAWPEGLSPTQRSALRAHILTKKPGRVR